MTSTTTLVVVTSWISVNISAAVASGATGSLAVVIIALLTLGWGWLDDLILLTSARRDSFFLRRSISWPLEGWMRWGGLMSWASAVTRATTISVRSSILLRVPVSSWSLLMSRNSLTAYILSGHFRSEFSSLHASTGNVPAISVFSILSSWNHSSRWWLSIAHLCKTGLGLLLDGSFFAFLILPSRLSAGSIIVSSLILLPLISLCRWWECLLRHLGIFGCLVCLRSLDMLNILLGQLFKLFHGSNLFLQVVFATKCKSVEL